MCVRELQICKFCAKTKEVIELCEKLKEKPDEIAAAKDYLSCPQLARSDLKETQVDGKAFGEHKCTVPTFWDEKKDGDVVIGCVTEILDEEDEVEVNQEGQSGTNGN